MGLVAFTKTLAREGEKYNIRATAIAPVRIFNGTAAEALLTIHSDGC